MFTIYIDNMPYTVDGTGKNLLEVCLTLGFDLPFFCWHPALHSVGACRQCAVKQFKDEHDTYGRLIMSCMTPVVEGMRISVEDAEAVAFRAGIIEWMMVNHPHDCPVCDEGGECHLQDMTEMTGHVDRRMRFPKRTYQNQYLGPLINHEMNRCIQCYRCVRYYREIAGGHDLAVTGWHDHLYFGREADGILENEFSGNLVEICPTGVFTDKTFDHHFTRKWDLQTAPSICVHCGAGCNTIPGERYGLLRRIRNRFHDKVNGYFLCDRGRFGYEFVNDAHRIREPLMRIGTHLQPVETSAVHERLSRLLTSGRVIGIGSPRASLEANYALQHLVGAENFYHGISAQEHLLMATILALLRHGPARTPSQQEVAGMDAVLIFGEDVNEVTPTLALPLRQAALRSPKDQIARPLGVPIFDDFATREAIQGVRGPFYVATPLATRLDDEATAIYRAAPDNLARLGHAIAHAIDPSAPAEVDLPIEMQTIVDRAAADLLAADHPLIISGFSLGSLPLLQAAMNVVRALQSTSGKGEVLFSVPECNSMGLAMMSGESIETALASFPENPPVTVLVLENDLFHRLDSATVESLLTDDRHVIVIDALEHATSTRAEVVLPAATFAESEGTLVNHEGRAQRFFAVMPAQGAIQESWRWLSDLHPLTTREVTIPWRNFDEVLNQMATELPVFRHVPEAAPGADYRQCGQKIPRQTHRFSGRTAMAVTEDIHEQPPPVDRDSPLAFSMEGYQGQPPAPVVPRFWAPGWNSIQSVLKYQRESGGALHGGPSGVRLLEPVSTGMLEYFTQIPTAFAPRTGEWLVVPAYHVFGSEETSHYAPGIAELSPQPYLALRREDAQRLGLADGEPIALIVEGTKLVLTVKTMSLPEGVVALPVGLQGMRRLTLPAWGVLAPARRPDGGMERSHE